MKKIILTKKAPAPIGPYNQAVSSGGLLFVSGQLPIDPENGEMISGDIKKETHQIFENIKHILEAGGSSLEKIVKVTIYMKDISLFPEVNTVYGDFFIKDAPARAVVEVSALPKNASMEVECIAIV